MGPCVSKQPQKQTADVENAKNKEIEDTMKLQKRSRPPIMLLLLGAGESGKSTVFKQMQIIHNNGYTTKQKKGFVTVIRRHLVDNLRDLVAGGERLGLLPEEIIQNATQLLDEVGSRGVETKHVEKITALWKSEELQEAFKQRNRFQLADSAQHFLDNVERIMRVEYIPTNEDILMCRVRTTGVSEIQFSNADVDFRLVDVGGQRNERRKWIHCFENVEAVIFVAAINEYDQVLFEDESTNRLKEAIKLFDEVCSIKCFEDTPIILFLNKRDLFEEKIATVDLNVCFPDYTGGCNRDPAIDFIKAKFLNQLNHDSQNIFVHATTATDSGNMLFVFDSIKESILMQNVSGSGIF